MESRGNQRAIGAKQQVIRTPRIATDTLDVLFVAPNDSEALECIVVKLGYVPLQSTILFDGLVRELMRFAYREFAIAESAEDNTTAFGAKIAGNVVILHKSPAFSASVVPFVVRASISMV